jgi:energy-coupling factor transporter ATP-binding protein EcfA2
MAQPDFFARSISVNAIVGKNGSGKSTLLEIVFRLINNLGYVLLYYIQRSGADALHYVYGLHARMDYMINEKRFAILCVNETLTWMEGDTILFNAVVGKDGLAVKYSSQSEKLTIEDFEQLTQNLFYTIVVNYSVQAYASQDYLGEKIQQKKQKAGVAKCPEEAWINRLFHKNDGYMCPIVLNPYRDKGKLDMNIEMRLTQQRTEAMLIFYKRKGIDFIDGYKLKTIEYTFHPEVVNDYFDDESLASLIEKRYTLRYTKELAEDGFKSETQKRGWIFELFKEVLEMNATLFPKEILKVFSIDPYALKGEDMQAAALYLVCKVINIGMTYPTYDTNKSEILPDDEDEFDFTQVLDVNSNQLLIAPMRKLAKKVKRQKGHISLKVGRVVLFLRAKQKRNIDIGENFTFEDYEKAFWKGMPTNSVDRISKILPPSIFFYEIMLEKTVNGVCNGEIVPMRQMSSGERQFVFTTSTIAYHLQNLRSVREPSPRYRNIHLILDEVEICFHPEYQRTFVSKLLQLLTRLQLNTDWYEGCHISIWIVTHSPFILSDIPQRCILYLKDGHQESGSSFVNPFGANINDILKQSFFLEHGFMGEFVRCSAISLCHYLGAKVDAFRDIPSMYKNITWTAEKASAFIEEVGEPILRGQLMRVFKESEVVSGQSKIKMLEKEIENLKKRTRNEKDSH